MYYGQFRIFGEEDLRSFFQERMRDLQSKVKGETDDYILNVNENEYISHLFSRYSIEPLNIFADKLSVEPVEKEVQASRFPKSFFVEDGRSYTKTAFRYYLPFTGDQVLLRKTPSSRILWTMTVSVEDECICFEIIDFYNDASKIKRRADENIKSIKQQLENIQEEVKTFNTQLKSIARNKFTTRKEKLLKKNDVAAQLGVPIRKKQNVKGTFAVPNPSVREKIKVKKPSTSKGEGNKEPTLDSSTYHSILSIIHDVGRQFERMPSTYKDKGEEDLRDHILLFLEPNFDGSATGETFNKEGKTDILLRYEGSNVFIAECKFWSGAKGLKLTIDQLLNYLTWRDSKAAIVLFVDRENFSAVISQIKDTAKDHENYVGFNSSENETWFKFQFHLNDDPNRELSLAIMLYHIPK